MPKKVGVHGRRLRRSLPYLQVLLNAKTPKIRNSLLKMFPDFVIDDLYEILYNVVHSNINISVPSRQKLTKHKTAILKLVRAVKSKNKTRRNVVYKQHGGFLGAVLPIALGILSSAFL